jgi:predicted DNA-binding transcriptional regulator YafY
MDLYARWKKLEMIHHSILHRSTGTPDQLAQRAGIARRTLYEYLLQLKSLGAEIKYNKTGKYFYYANYFDIQIYIDSRPSDDSYNLK